MPLIRGENPPIEPLPPSGSDLEYWVRKLVGIVAPATPAGAASSVLWDEATAGDRPPSTASEIGSKGLDYLSMLGLLVPLLMGKGRGAKVFGKEMMDTSRRALPQKWAQMQQEENEAVLAMLKDPANRERPRQFPVRTPPGYEGWRGRTDYEAGAMPPAGSLDLPAGAPRPRDVVREGLIDFRDPRRGGTDVQINGYQIGDPVALPGGESAYYVVKPDQRGFWNVDLMAGGGLRTVHTVATVGEALVKARQLQNRLALAAKDPVLVDPENIYRQRPIERQIRFPWERGTSAGPGGPGQHGPLWRYDYQEPPARGRWSE